MQRKLLAKRLYREFLKKRKVRPIGTRVCRICGEEKDLIDFYFNAQRWTYPSWVCNNCLKIKSKVAPIDKQCIACLKFLPFYRFNYSKESSDLLSPLCIECSLKYRVCTSCNKALPFAMFPKRGHTEKGIQRYFGICKLCKKAKEN